MAESLKDVIAKLKAQNSQQQTATKPVEMVKPAPRKEVEIPAELENEDDGDDEILEDDEETEQKEIKNPSQQEVQAQQIMMEIEMLQNDGRYRAELLHQLQEMNRALVVIAGVLVDLSGTKK